MTRISQGYSAVRVLWSLLSHWASIDEISFHSVLTGYANVKVAGKYFIISPSNSTELPPRNIRLEFPSRAWQRLQDWATGSPRRAGDGSGTHQLIVFKIQWDGTTHSKTEGFPWQEQWWHTSLFLPFSVKWERLVTGQLPFIWACGQLLHESPLTDCNRETNALLMGAYGLKIVWKLTVELSWVESFVVWPNVDVAIGNFWDLNERETVFVVDCYSRVTPAMAAIFPTAREPWAFNWKSEIFELSSVCFVCNITLVHWVCVNEHVRVVLLQIWWMHEEQKKIVNSTKMTGRPCCLSQTKVAVNTARAESKLCFKSSPCEMARHNLLLVNEEWWAEQVIGLNGPVTQMRITVNSHLKQEWSLSPSLGKRSWCYILLEGRCLGQLTCQLSAFEMIWSRKIFRRKAERVPIPMNWSVKLRFSNTLFRFFQIRDVHQLGTLGVQVFQPKRSLPTFLPSEHNQTRNSKHTGSSQFSLHWQIDVVKHFVLSETVGGDTLWAVEGHQ